MTTRIVARDKLLRKRLMGKGIEYAIKISNIIAYFNQDKK